MMMNNLFFQIELFQHNKKTNVFLAGYDTNVDMKDEGPIENIIVDGEAMTDVANNVFNGTAVDISNWGWIQQ